MTRAVFDASAAVPLLERESSLSVLGDALGEVERSGWGAVVFVTSEAGGGKTTLLRRFTDIAGRDRTIWCGCDPLFNPRPLGPFIDIAERAGDELSAVIAGGGQPYDVVAALARHLSTKPGLVLIVEDAHWADEATLDVVRLLARRLDTVPALVVVSFRDDELDKRHPLRLLAGELATRPSVRSLKLSGLSVDAVRQLASQHDVDPDELHRMTAGNPFFVVEALAAATATIPGTVRDAVLARAARLGPAARELVETIAMMPEQVPFWLLERLAPDLVHHLGECVTSGMVSCEDASVGFRHELARLALAESVVLDRRIAAHRRALSALADPPVGPPDLARLVHHAEAAGDVHALCRYSPAAAAHASAVGAHREAASLLRRVLDSEVPLQPSETADLLQRFAAECYITDQYDDGIAALNRAIPIRESLGDGLRQAAALTQLGEFLWCPGRTNEAESCVRAAIEILESLPPSRELANAYQTLAMICSVAPRPPEADHWAAKAMSLADRTGDRSVFIRAQATLGPDLAPDETLVAVLGEAEADGYLLPAATVCLILGGRAMDRRCLADAEVHLSRGLALSLDHGLELYRLYFLAAMARVELERGNWEEATQLASAVLQVPRTSTSPRISALVVLGLVRGRRGDPGADGALDEALALAAPTGELPRLGPVALARAELAWLGGDAEAVSVATGTAMQIATDRNASDALGRLLCWRQRAGLPSQSHQGVPEPCSLELDGRLVDAAAIWSRLGYRYEAAVVLSASDDREQLRQAHAELLELGAARVAGLVARRMRERGVRGVSRGPRANTRRNPAQLTDRELEVLSAMSGGGRNRTIAGTLFVSEKTVDHHVSSILRKLGVSSRLEAVARARELGVL